MTSGPTKSFYREAKYIHSFAFFSHFDLWPGICDAINAVSEVERTCDYVCTVWIVRLTFSRWQPHWECNVLQPKKFDTNNHTNTNSFA